ncbi:MAG: DUF2334 domain-containing protein [Opitutaceae bacterium]
MRYVIVRDDDTCAATPVDCLERLYRPFLDAGLPVNLAVIPEVRTTVRVPSGRREGFLTAGRLVPGAVAPIAHNRELVDFLRHEPGFHVVQHGCHHDYLEFDRLDASEIGRRLELGGRRLREAGLDPGGTFVAPYDRLSREAFFQVSRRFRVLSTGWFEGRRLPVRWWPPYLATKMRRRPHWKAGGTFLLSHPGCLLSFHHAYGGMEERVARAVGERNLTVLVTHWWEYFRDGAPDSDFISILHRVARWLAAQRDIRVTTFSAVAAGRVPLN